MKSKLTKKLFFSLLSCILIVSSIMLSGCSRRTIGYSVKAMPNKVVYQIGERVDLEGLKIQSIASDGTYTTCRYSLEDVSNVDTSTAGKKKVTVEKDNMSISFDIYVANVIVNDSDDLKSIFENLSDGDIVYLRAGNYSPQNNTDNSYKDVVINKSVTIVGDGIEKTNFYGNFVVGANFDGESFVGIESFSNVSFYGIGFEIKYTIKDRFLNYSGPYGKTDENGAIRFFEMSNLSVQNCSFKGYGYGIFGDSVNGLTVKNCQFKDIKKIGILTQKDTQNTSIYKNLFADIGSNIVAFENGNQSLIGAISLHFASEGERGVIISKNVFNRIALHTGDIVYYDETSKIDASSTTTDIFKISYINNSAVISLLSSTTDDLSVLGVVLGTNNYSEALRIVYFGTNGKNTVNANGILDA